jgi:HNH endonuclease
MRITPGKGTEPGRMLRPGKTKDGYLKVELFNNGTPCSRYVHRLVVEAFIGKVPAGLEVNHISGQKEDNRLENVEVVTHAQNTAHAWETGLRGRTTFKLAA